MQKIIENFIKEIITTSGIPYYREPLFGYAAADDPIFNHFKTAVGPNHLLPSDLLSKAQSVLAFFLPFQRQIIEHNRSGALASREWAEVYLATNRLISQILAETKLYLAEFGIHLVAQPPTSVFDRTTLIACWSHRHIAYACGLGTFGRNHLLITRKGSGGRIGSAVLDLPLVASPRSEVIQHCFYHSRQCNYCLKVCPVQAFDNGEFERTRCFQQCQENDRHWHDLETTEVCGKCATGPCACLET